MTDSIAETVRTLIDRVKLDDLEVAAIIMAPDVAEKLIAEVAELASIPCYTSKFDPAILTLFGVPIYVDPRAPKSHLYAVDNVFIDEWLEERKKATT